MNRLKPLIASLAVTGLIAGGGAALASAATSSTPTTPSTSTTKTPPPMPNHGAAPGKAGSKNCPNM